MDDRLYSALTENTDEEDRILRGEGIDKALYTREDGFVVNGARLRGSDEIAARLHTRYTEFPLHRHTYLEMMSVQGGSITHRIDGKAIKLEAGDLLFINKHLTHSIDKAEENDLGVNVIMSDRFAEAIAPRLEGTVFFELLKSNSESDGEGAYLHFRTGGSKAVENLTENILAALTYEKKAKPLLPEMTELLMKLLSIMSGDMLASGSIPLNKKSRRKNEILSYVRTEYRTATLGELARKTDLSAPYLSAEIKRIFGKSFSELLIDERIKRADELIVSTDMPIGEIIRSVGYENESYFHREYKRRNGIPPLAKRKNK